MQYQRAVHIRIKTLGANHPAIARYRVPLGEALRREGKLADAQHQFERAVGVAERAMGPDHPDVAAGLVGLGTVLAQGGSAAEALPHLERALRIRTAARPVSPVEVAAAQFALAQALSEHEHGRALALATEARAALAKAGPTRAQDLAEVEEWLAKRRAK